MWSRRESLGLSGSQHSQLPVSTLSLTHSRTPGKQHPLYPKSFHCTKEDDTSLPPTLSGVTRLILFPFVKHNENDQCCKTASGEPEEIYSWCPNSLPHQDQQSDPVMQATVVSLKRKGSFHPYCSISLTFSHAQSAEQSFLEEVHAPH